MYPPFIQRTSSPPVSLSIDGHCDLLCKQLVILLCSLQFTLLRTKTCRPLGPVSFLNLCPAAPALVVLYGVPLLDVQPLCLHILLETLPLVTSIASLPAVQEMFSVIKFRMSQAFVRKTSTQKGQVCRWR